MKIIKVGKVSPLVTEQGTEIVCERCTSVLEYFKDDVKHHINESENLYYVVCPVCLHVYVVLHQYFE